jgi:hypothetical protein
MAKSYWQVWRENPCVSYKLDDDMIIVRVGESGARELQSEWMRLLGDVDSSVRQLIYEIEREQRA